jgi:hypothetical protein
VGRRRRRRPPGCAAFGLSGWPAGDCKRVCHVVSRRAKRVARSSLDKLKARPLSTLPALGGSPCPRPRRTALQTVLLALRASASPPSASLPLPRPAMLFRAGGRGGGCRSYGIGAVQHGQGRERACLVGGAPPARALAQAGVARRRPGRVRSRDAGLPGSAGQQAR